MKKCVSCNVTFHRQRIDNQSQTNCLTEVMFIDAIEQATNLDEQFANTGNPVGPLHGVPVTLKDQFDVVGYDTTLGYVGRAFQPATQDSVLVDMLQRLGAIVIAKTNLPQSIMWCETENPLWGLTTHPSNPELTPGGSSGGEGALLALHGSILGFGTDIGGSIRIPASMCGLYGLKPSVSLCLLLIPPSPFCQKKIIPHLTKRPIPHQSGRFPFQNVQISSSGQEHVPSVAGPISRTLSTLTLATRACLSLNPWTLDPKCHPLPWRDDIYTATLAPSRPLTIGVILDDGVVRPHPPIARHLKRAVDALRSAGHTVVEWAPVGHAEIVALMDEYYTVDGGEDVRSAVEAGGEPFLPHVRALVDRGEAVGVMQYWALHRRKVELQKAYLDRWREWRGPGGEEGLDVLLTPTMPHVAVRHRACRWVGYTKVWNLLDYTAVSMPVGVVDKEVDVKVEGYECRSDLERHVWSLYEPELMHGLPVSLQVVGQRLEEEKVLAAAEVIEDVLKAANKS